MKPTWCESIRATVHPDRCADAAITLALAVGVVVWCLFLALAVGVLAVVVWCLFLARLVNWVWRC